MGGFGEIPKPTVIVWMGEDKAKVKTRNLGMVCPGFLLRV
jgi:hypothetical protein